MAPFPKLFGSSSHDAYLLRSTTGIPSLPTTRGHGNTRVSRLVPKTGLALAASATTVYTGAGKSDRIHAS